MPLYDYDCAACGQRSEVLRGVYADEPTMCPLCGRGPLKKAFATPAIHFKGSGWAKKERRATSSAGAPKVAGDGGSGSASGGSDDSGSTTSDGASASKDSSGGSDTSTSSSSGDAGGGSEGSTTSAGSTKSKDTSVATPKAKGD